MGEEGNLHFLMVGKKEEKIELTCLSSSYLNLLRLFQVLFLPSFFLTMLSEFIFDLYFYAFGYFPILVSMIHGVYAENEKLMCWK